MKWTYLFFLFLVLTACTTTPHADIQNDRYEFYAASSNCDLIGKPPSGMVYIPGGKFILGSVDSEAHPTEGPAIDAEVSGFYMDEAEVTNAQFAAFVKATGYKTVSERPIDWKDFALQLPPGTPRPPDSLLQAGSL